MATARFDPQHGPHEHLSTEADHVMRSADQTNVTRDGGKQLHQQGGKRGSCKAGGQAVHDERAVGIPEPARKQREEGRAIRCVVHDSLQLR